MNHKVAFSFADGKTLFFPVGSHEILLDAALRNGIKIPLDCREGVCGTCQGRCESGDYSQDYVDEEALSSFDLQQRKMLSCQTRVKSDATFYFDFDSSLCNAPGPVQVRGTVSAVEQVSAGTAILHVQLDQALDFLPGQYARIAVPGTDSWRSYSFANRPGNQLQFLVRLLPDGVMSNYLRERCQVGDELLMAGVRRGASDLHLSAGLTPMLRVDGEVWPLDWPVLSAPVLRAASIPLSAGPFSLVADSCASIVARRSARW